MDDHYSIKSDKQLWSEFISGNKEAFRIIYEKHIQQLFKFGLHFSQNEDLIKDCIHDLFIDLNRYRSRLKETDNIKAYIFVSYKRIIIRKIQRENKSRSININDLQFDYSLFDSDDESAITENRLKMLEMAMAKLTARQREAIYLKFVAGLNYDELCHVLQLNYQASRNLVHRAIEKLRNSIQNIDVLLWFFFLRTKT